MAGYGIATAAGSGEGVALTVDRRITWDSVEVALGVLSGRLRKIDSSQIALLGMAIAPHVVDDATRHAAERVILMALCGGIR